MAPEINQYRSYHDTERIEAAAGAAGHRQWRWGMTGWRSRTGVVAAGLLALSALAPAGVATQEQFQFVVAARDPNGQPVTDLKREEVVMTEAGVANDIVKIEPFHLPVKLTIAVDNGIL